MASLKLVTNLSRFRQEFEWIVKGRVVDMPFCLRLRRLRTSIGAAGPSGCRERHDVRRGRLLELMPLPSRSLRPKAIVEIASTSCTCPGSNPSATIAFHETGGGIVPGEVLREMASPRGSESQAAGGTEASAGTRRKRSDLRRRNGRGVICAAEPVRWRSSPNDIADVRRWRENAGMAPSRLPAVKIPARVRGDAQHVPAHRSTGPAPTRLKGRGKQ